MDSILEKSLLYDFYGELLTEHQRHVYEQVVLEDLSLGEAAELTGISRQGVHDLIHRCESTLEDYEEKLHLVRHFMEIRGQMREISVLLDSIESPEDRAAAEQIRGICDRIVNEL